jgi:hypothetical protein
MQAIAVVKYYRARMIQISLIIQPLRKARSAFWLVGFRPFPVPSGEAEDPDPTQMSELFSFIVGWAKT